MDRRERSRGFTLLEILLVTLIIGILISVASVRFRRTFDNIKFRNYVLDTAALLRYAHDNAILEKDTYRIRFTEDPAGYRLEKAPGLYREGQSKFQRVKDRTGALRQLPTHVAVDLEPTGIVFYPDGTASEALWAFTDSQDRTMSIVVTAETGDSRVEDYRE
jgi:prepilin-type N-terminal cleavage/methylation domain-containing protein